MVNLKKDDVVDGGTAVRLKNQKNGTLNQRIPLNVYAQKLVKKNINNPTQFVFAGRGREGGLADFKKAWTTVRKIAGVNKDIHTPSDTLQLLKLQRRWIMFLNSNNFQDIKIQGHLKHMFI